MYLLHSFTCVEFPCFCCLYLQWCRFDQIRSSFHYVLNLRISTATKQSGNSLPVHHLNWLLWRWPLFMYRINYACFSFSQSSVTVAIFTAMLQHYLPAQIFTGHDVSLSSLWFRQHKHLHPHHALPAQRDLWHAVLMTWLAVIISTAPLAVGARKLVYLSINYIFLRDKPVKFIYGLWARINKKWPHFSDQYTYDIVEKRPHRLESWHCAQLPDRGALQSKTQMSNVDIWCLLYSYC